MCTSIPIVCMVIEQFLNSFIATTLSIRPVPCPHRHQASEAFEEDVIPWLWARCIQFEHLLCTY